MTDKINLTDTFTSIAEQVRLRVAEEYPDAKVTSIDFDTEIAYPMTYGDLSSNRIPSPVPVNISFRVRAFTLLPDKPYQHSHIFTISIMPDGMQIIGVDTRKEMLS